MTDIEMALVCFINEYHRRVIYRNEKYQMLHGVKYQREFDLEYTQKIRSKYNSNCFEAAYELKTYYAENGILSNEYSDAKVHPFRKFRAPFSGKAEHTFPE